MKISYSEQAIHTFYYVDEGTSSFILLQFETHVSISEEIYELQSYLYIQV